MTILAGIVDAEILAKVQVAALPGRHAATAPIALIASKQWMSEREVLLRRIVQFAGQRPIGIVGVVGHSISF